MELSEINILVERAKSIMHRLAISPYHALIEAEKELIREYTRGKEIAWMN